MENHTSGGKKLAENFKRGGYFRNHIPAGGIRCRGKLARKPVFGSGFAVNGREQLAERLIDSPHAVIDDMQVL